MPPTHFPDHTVQGELLGGDRREMDRAGDEGGGDRQARDGDVVEDLADRVGEGPGVREVHEGAVDRVEQDCNSRREAADSQTGDCGNSRGSSVTGVPWAVPLVFGVFASVRRLPVVRYGVPLAQRGQDDRDQAVRRRVGR